MVEYSTYLALLEKFGLKATEMSVARYLALCETKKHIDDADIIATVSDVPFTPKYSFYDAVISKDGVELWVQGAVGMQKLRGKGASIESAIMNALKIEGFVERKLSEIGDMFYAFVSVTNTARVASDHTHLNPGCAIASALVDCYNRQQYLQEIVKAEVLERNQPV